MARTIKANPRLAPPMAPAPRPSLGPGLQWLGWTMVAVGAPLGFGAQGHWSATLGLVSGALGLVLVAGGLVSTPRAPSAERLPFALGTLALLTGSAGLIYPCFTSRDALRGMHETASFVPMLSVLAVLLGGVLLLVGLNRQRADDPPFALEEGERAVPWWRELDPRRFFFETWREIDREAAEERARTAGDGYDWRPLSAFALGAVCLALMEYFGHAPTLHGVVAHLDSGESGGLVSVLRRSAFWEPSYSQVRGLTDFVWWSGWRVLGFFLLPAVIVKLVLRGRLIDYGLSTNGFLRHAWIYGVFFGIVLVAVVVVSFDEHFATYYPFYKHASRSWYDFWAWELLYAAQFFSLEFFFRGFWLKAAKRSMGSHAIFAMVVPYCMIHFGKPFLETLAAILAGIVLGTLALRTRSIWSGFLIHVSVAVSMDLAVLLQSEGLPGRWWPPV